MMKCKAPLCNLDAKLGSDYCGRVCQIADELGLWQINDRDEIVKLCDQVMAENPKAAKEQARSYLLGRVMKKSAGRANPKMAGEILDEILSMTRNV